MEAWIYGEIDEIDSLILEKTRVGMSHQAEVFAFLAESPIKFAQVHF